MSVTTVRTWQKAMDTKKEERKMKVLHEYCFNPFDMLDDEELNNREERSLEFERALRNSDIPKRPGLGFVFVNDFGLGGLEDFKCIVELNCDESLDNILARFLPNCRTYYDVMLVY